MIITFFSVNSKLSKTELKMQDFMKTDLKNLLILDVKLPPMSESTFIRTYKVGNQNRRITLLPQATLLIG